MTQPFNAGADDLLRLWQETMLPRRDPDQLARRVARIKLARFDRMIASRNLREYAGVAALVIMAGWLVLAGGDRIAAGLMGAAALFVASYLWRHDRQVPPLDPAMSARDYQAALLRRIDHQIRLLHRARYWYLLPLYLPVLRVAAMTWHGHPGAALLFLALATAFFVLVGWLNERVAVAHLWRERARVASLYDEEG